MVLHMENNSAMKAITLRFYPEDLDAIEVIRRVPSGGKLAKAEAVRVAVREAAERREAGAAA